MNEDIFIAITNGSHHVVIYILSSLSPLPLDVKNKLDDLHKVVKSFQDRAGFTEDLEKMASVSTASIFIQLIKSFSVTHLCAVYRVEEILLTSKKKWEKRKQLPKVNLYMRILP